MIEQGHQWQTNINFLNGANGLVSLPYQVKDFWIKVTVKEEGDTISSTLIMHEATYPASVILPRAEPPKPRPYSSLPINPIHHTPTTIPFHSPDIYAASFALCPQKNPSPPFSVLNVITLPFGKKNTSPFVALTLCPL